MREGKMWEDTVPSIENIEVAFHKFFFFAGTYI